MTHIDKLYKHSPLPVTESLAILNDTRELLSKDSISKKECTDILDRLKLVTTVDSEKESLLIAKELKAKVKQVETK